MQINSSDRSWVEIDLSAFRANLRYLKSFLAPGQDFMQIVKADAYGHGAREIAQAALMEGAVYLGVANLEEGKMLRIQGIDAPILILSPSLQSEIPAILEYHLVPGVHELGFAQALSAQTKRSQKVHIKLDTGMHRSGVRIDEALSMYDAIAGLPNIEVEGIFSHFAAAESDTAFSLRQEDEFSHFMSSLSQRPRYVHLSNSAATLKAYGKGCNLARFGILSFGVCTIDDEEIARHLHPVMTFRSRISQIKRIREGESVGYNRDWIAPRDGCYAVIPIGYADGYDFLLSNKGKVSINGCVYPVVGRVSMDMITVFFDQDSTVNPGDAVTLIGDNEAQLRAQSIAGLYGGSAYELLCQIGRRARRYYRSGEELLHSAPLARRDFVAPDFNDGKLSEIISAALSQRLQSAEIGELISHEILRSFFADRDRDVHYRKDFVHSISFEASLKAEYFRAVTHLSYHKVLQSDSFIVACARSDEQLRRYFLRRDVEYRWLLDEKLALDEESFTVSSARVDDLELECRIKHRDGSLEIHCSHPGLKDLVGSEVRFSIDTITLYPRHLHQFSVFISELTQGVKIDFQYPDSLSEVQPVTIFSGRRKNPVIHRKEGSISIVSAKDEWIFPLSGVVFSY
ncbi:MAG: alanine racemase [Candidatus Cloacimonetes bacterium]|nr:alanine racemase [Candidatus Cloacimonadota bacterium]